MEPLAETAGDAAAAAGGECPRLWGHSPRDPQDQRVPRTGQVPLCCPSGSAHPQPAADGAAGGAEGFASVARSGETPGLGTAGQPGWAPGLRPRRDGQGKDLETHRGPGPHALARAFGRRRPLGGCWGRWEVPAGPSAGSPAARVRPSVRVFTEELCPERLTRTSHQPHVPGGTEGASPRGTGGAGRVSPARAAGHSDSPAVWLPFVRCPGHFPSATVVMTDRRPFVSDGPGGGIRSCPRPPRTAVGAPSAASVPRGLASSALTWLAYRGTNGCLPALQAAQQAALPP